MGNKTQCFKNDKPLTTFERKPEPISENRETPDQKEPVEDDLEESKVSQPQPQLPPQYQNWEIVVKTQNDSELPD